VQGVPAAASATWHVPGSKHVAVMHAVSSCGQTPGLAHEPPPPAPPDELLAALLLVVVAAVVVLPVVAAPVSCVTPDPHDHTPMESTASPRALRIMKTSVFRA
jgi:hypothetical protein